MAEIQWWLLQMDPADVDEFGLRYVANHNDEMTPEDAIDAAGKSILADAGVTPGERYLWTKPVWADAEKVEYEKKEVV